jgi:hypothetical protein
VRKLASFATALFCLVWLTGATWLPLFKSPSGGGGCAQATTFLARTSGLSGTEISAYTNLICGLVTDGIITGTLSGAAGCGSVLDALYILATNTTTTAALNICGTSFSLITNGTTTFTADAGIAGDASTGFLNTQFEPDIAGGNFSLNSASMGSYVRTNRTSPANKASMGGSLQFSIIIPFDGSGNFQYGSNGTNGTSVVANPVGTSQGFWVQSRTSGSANAGYRNGNVTPLATDATAPSFITATPIWILGIDNGSVLLPTDDQISAAFIGGGITATQQNKISNRINAYMTALGINVY